MRPISMTLNIKAHCKLDKMTHESTYSTYCITSSNSPTDQTLILNQSFETPTSLNTCDLQLKDPANDDTPQG